MKNGNRTTKRKVKGPNLSPYAPGLDEMTRRRRRVLAQMRKMSTKQILALAIQAGIYTKSGKLTARYRSDSEPSAHRSGQ